MTERIQDFSKVASAEDAASALAGATIVRFEAGPPPVAHMRSALGETFRVSFTADVEMLTITGNGAATVKAEGRPHFHFDNE